MYRLSETGGLGSPSVKKRVRRIAAGVRRKSVACVAVVACAVLAVSGVPAVAFAAVPASVSAAAASLSNDVKADAGSTSVSDSGTSAAGSTSASEGSSAQGQTSSISSASASDKAADSSGGTPSGTAAATTETPAAGTSTAAPDGSSSAAVSSQSEASASASANALAPQADVIDSGTFSTDASASWTLQQDGTLVVTGTGAVSDSYARGGTPWGSHSSAITAVAISGDLSIEHLSYWFAGLSALQRVSFNGNFGKSTADMTSMFEDCAALQNIDTPVDFGSSATVMQDMFSGCASLSTATLRSGFGLKTTTIKRMFYGCAKLSLVSFDTGFGQKALDASSLFGDCSSLANLSFPSGFGAKLTTMNSMLKGCSSLVTLDLSSISAAATSDLTDALAGCTQLAQVKLGADWSFKGTRTFVQTTLPEPVAPNTSWQAVGTGSVSKPQGTAWKPADLANCYTSSMADTYVLSQTNPLPGLSGSVSFTGDFSIGSPVAVKAADTQEGANITYTWYRAAGDGVAGTAFATGDTYTPVDSDLGAYLYVIASDSSGTYYGGIASNSMLVRIGLTGDIALIGTPAPGSTMTAEVHLAQPGAVASYVWYKSSDTTSVGTQVATGTTYLVQPADLGSYLYVAVTDSSGEYAGTVLSGHVKVTVPLSGLIGVSGTQGVGHELTAQPVGAQADASFSYSWYAAPDATSSGIRVGQGATYKPSVDDFGKNLYVTAVDTSGKYAGSIVSARMVVVLTDTFPSNPNASWTLSPDGVIVFSGTGTVTDCYSLTNQTPWYAYRSLITSAVFNGQVSYDHLDYWLYDAEHLASVSMSAKEGQATQSMPGMFAQCKALKTVTLSEGFGQSAIEMNELFSGCQSLATLTVPAGFGSAGEGMRQMFFDCTALESLDLSGASSLKATNMGDMFEGCAALRQVKLGPNWSFMGIGSGVLCRLPQPANTLWRAVGEGTPESPQGQAYTPDELAASYTSASADTYVCADASLFGVSSISGNPNTGSTLTASLTNGPTDAHLLYEWYLAPDGSSLGSKVGTGTTYVPVMSDFGKYLYVVISDTSGKYSGTIQSKRLAVCATGTFPSDPSASWTLDSDGILDFDGTGMVVESYDSTTLPWGLYRPYITAASFKGSVIYANFSHWFDGCSALQSVAFANGVGQTTPTMDYMFRGCTGLSSIDFPAEFGSNTASMTGMFENCSSLVSFTSIPYFGFTAERVDSMFAGCSSLEQLDLSASSFRRASNMSNMFTGCTDLMQVKLGEKWSFKGVGSTVLCTLPVPASPYTDWKAVGAGTLADPAGQAYTCEDLASQYNPSMADTYVRWNSNAPALSGTIDIVGAVAVGLQSSSDIDGFPSDATLSYAWFVSSDAALTGTQVGEREFYRPTPDDYGKYLHVAVRDTSGHYLGSISSSVSQIGRGGYFPSDKNATWVFSPDGTLTFAGYGTINDTYTHDGIPWASYRAQITKVVFLSETFPTSLDYWFSDCSALTSIALPVGFDRKTLSMRGLFQGCTALSDLTLYKGFGSNATDMNGVFAGCTSLSAFAVPLGFAASATDISSMFDGCSALSALTVPEWFGLKAVFADNAFRGCSKLTSLGFSEGFGATIQSMAGLFKGCSSLVSLDLSQFDSHAATDMTGMFDGCTALGQVNLGEKWTFKGAGQEVLCKLAEPLPPYTRWHAVGAGTVLDPAGKWYTPTELALTFSSLLADTYVPCNPDASDMTGTVVVSGHTWVGSTMTAELTQAPIGAMASYTWFRSSDDHSEGTQVGTGPSYVPTLDDFGQYIHADVRDSSGHYTKAVWSYPVLVTAGGAFASNPDAWWTFEPNGTLSFCGKGQVSDVYDTGTVPWEPYSSQIKSVAFPGSIDPTNTDCWFAGLSHLSSLSFPEGFGQHAVSMAAMFSGCSSLSKLYLPKGFGSAATDLSRIFCDCASLEALTLPEGFGSQATAASNLFTGCRTMSYLDMTQANFRMAQDMRGAFDGCWRLRQVGLGWNWSFRGAGSTVLCQLPDPSSPYVSWQALGTGTAAQPLGQSWDPAVLSTAYIGDMADFYVLSTQAPMERLSGTLSVTGTYQLGSSLELHADALPIAAAPVYTWYRAETATSPGVAIGTGTSYKLAVDDCDMYIYAVATDSSGRYAGKIASTRTPMTTKLSVTVPVCMSFDVASNGEISGSASVANTSMVPLRVGSLVASAIQPFSLVSRSDLDAAAGDNVLSMSLKAGSDSAVDLARCTSAAQNLNARWTMESTDGVLDLTASGQAKRLVGLTHDQPATVLNLSWSFVVDKSEGGW